MSNLLNNALKYAEHEIEVALEHNGETFSVRVTSDGEKIPIHLSEKDFPNPFSASTARGRLPGRHRTADGPLLAQLHKGHLFLDTAAPGNSFVLTSRRARQYINLQSRRKRSWNSPAKRPKCC